MTIDYTKPEPSGLPKPDSSSGSDAPVVEDGARSRTETSWAMAMHLGTLANYLGLELVGGRILVPLILWLWKRKDSDYLDTVGKEVLNFNLSFLVCVALLVLFTIVTLGLGVIVFFIGYAILAVVHIVCSVLATIEASNGGVYRYPLTIRFVK